MNSIAEQAMKVAEEAHKGQFRKFGDDKGKPYIVHPYRVAERFDSADFQAVGYLHDVVEDTALTENDLVNLFPFRIVEAVMSVTRREGEEYVDFIVHAKKNPYGREVKLADLRDNMRSLRAGSLRDKYMLAEEILLI